MKRILYLLAMFFVVIEASAITPKWLRTTPQAINATYIFVPITVSANSYENGRNEALRALAVDRGLLNSVRVSSRTVTQSDESQNFLNGKLSEHLDIHTVETITYDGKPIKLQAHIVDEYLDVKNGTFSSLYQVAVMDSPLFDDVWTTTQYGAHGLWRSMIVPGWGQYYKGAKAKGAMFLGGTAALAGGMVYCQSRITNSRNLAAQTYNPEHLRIYSRRISNFSTARNVCIGATAALYIWNLVDAVVAPGARRVVVRPAMNFGGYSLENSNSSADAVGLSAALTF